MAGPTTTATRTGADRAARWPLHASASRSFSAGVTTTCSSVVRRLITKVLDPDLTLFITKSAIHAVIHEAACHRPEMLAHPAFEEELTHLARSCLRRPE